MSTSLGPLYVKHSVLGATRHDTLLAYRLCMSVNAVIPGHVRGAGLGSSTVDQVLKYTKYPKYRPSTSTGQVLIF